MVEAGVDGILGMVVVVLGRRHVAGWWCEVSWWVEAGRGPGSKFD
jgi:hypothetical protein